jgi:hypothetical protein
MSRSEQLIKLDNLDLLEKKAPFSRLTTKEANIDLKDGATYKGALEKSTRHGTGVYTYADGSTYEGEWQNGLKHGQGVYIGEDKITFVGSFVKGERHGPGKLTFPNGDIFEAEWELGKLKDSKATYKWFGDYKRVLTCELKNGKFSG